MQIHPEQAFENLDATGIFDIVLQYCSWIRLNRVVDNALLMDVLFGF
jgi:hypothetical protein